MSITDPQQETLNSEKNNNPNINFLTKKLNTSEMDIDPKITDIIKIRTKEKIEKKFQFEMKQLRETYCTKEKIYKEEISQLKVFEKRKLILINKKLRDTMAIIKSRNLLLELQNTKLKNQIKRKSQQIVKEINTTRIIDPNLNKSKNKNINENENEEEKEKEKEKKPRNYKKSQNYFLSKVNSEPNNNINLVNNGNKKTKNKKITKKRRKKKKKKNKKKNTEKKQEIPFEKILSLTRNNSFVKMEEIGDETDISIESLGNDMENLIRNDLGMKKSWSIADMDLRESQQKIQENFWVNKHSKKLSLTPTKKRKSRIIKRPISKKKKKKIKKKRSNFQKNFSKKKNNKKKNKKD
ncbi:hypothetical protein M0812_21176 [Anaeramoeba flamelloides]|uniref:Uncharacterized protein n=1 Tax=Anaeramoeba flamelloides TaxID=1746091 RepID=A0AAV7YTJ6_9EUKA|nr:hypothetical protein M0812_21176 [Anaeramoeba flamelloides]